MVDVARGQWYLSYDVAVVRWGNEQTRTDIVPIERIRWRVPKSCWAAAERPEHRSEPPMFPPWYHTSDPLSKQPRTPPQRVRKGMLAKYSVLLPQQFSWIQADELRQYLDNDSWFYGVVGTWPISLVDVIDGHLWCIRRCHPSEGGPILRLSALKKAKTSEDFLAALIARLLRVTAIPHWSSSETETPNVLNEMPQELWLEVFSCLDTITQTCLRAVCFAWMEILASSLLTACIIVTPCGNKTLQNFDRLSYVMLSPIFTCLSASTKRIIVDCRWRSVNEQELLKVFDMIHHVAQQDPSVRLETIHLVGLHCKFFIGTRN
ncbi:uncharacterized protein LOC129586456 [Paramacrobiotus metropolitanus]|uniref:uncharacterized protein LOC129586456 n=1 Tax=Paramacrobiotus metropolitanus TaxID=2943436 RepID=UPI0024462EEC|nr:uncharacterized protein LOC129586456 [Paramacrobiotus metropolitanus]